MDRSQLRRVVTDDKAKRLAFKQNLAQKIDIVQEEPLSVIPTFVPIGSRVKHPSLGVCIVHVIDEKLNNITLELVEAGTLIDLVLSQVRSKLVPLSNTEEPVYSHWEQHLPKEVARPPLVQVATGLMDRTYLPGQEPGKREPSPPLPLKPVPTPPTIPVGRLVWHPDLGACTVSSVDLTSNSIVLDFESLGKIDMVMTQVQPKLIPLDTPTRIHVKKQLLSPQDPVPVESTVETVKVVLPPIFRSWGSSRQYLYLTTESHLTAEKANDLLALLDEKPVLGSTQFEVLWDEAADKQKRDEYKSRLAKNLDEGQVVLAPRERVSDSLLVGRKVWHLDLGVCTVSAIDEDLNSIVLDFPQIGKLDMVLTYIQSRLSLVETETLDRAHKYEPPLVLQDIVPEIPVVKNIFLLLPPSLRSWLPRKQYSYLTTEKQLTPEEANDVIAFLDGKRQVGLTQFEITWDEKADKAKRTEFKSRLAKTLDEPLVTPKDRVTDALSIGRTVWHLDLGVCTVAAIDAEANSIILDFPQLGKLDMVLSYIQSRLSLVETKALDRARAYEPPAQVPQKVVPEKPVPRSRSLLLPPALRSWLPREQYGYLTGEKQLTSEQANDVLAALDGIPQAGSTQFDITWDQKADQDKRMSHKHKLAAKVDRSGHQETRTPGDQVPAPIDSGVRRVMDEKEFVKVTKVSELRKLSVTLPKVFAGWDQSSQYFFLTRTKQLTPDEANDLLAAYQGNLYDDKYEIIWSDT